MPLKLSRAFKFSYIAIAACLAIVIYTGFVLAPLNGDATSHTKFRDREPDPSTIKSPPSSGTPQNPLIQPHPQFRDSLRHDTFYITSWAGAGYTNQFMSHVNMIYLGLISNRIPIIAPFAQVPHIKGDLPMLPFGDIYDLQRLQETLRISVLEWRDVKISGNKTSTEIEEIGCWTTITENHRGVPEAGQIVRYLGVDASYTRLPTSVRFQGSSPLADELHVTFPHLAAMIFPEEPMTSADSLKVFQASRVAKHMRTPDTHLACFSSMYYVNSGVRGYEWQKSWSPAWQQIGKNLFFTQRLRSIGLEYVRRAFSILSDSVSDSDIPPFIVLHIRHGDFNPQCMGNGGTVHTCFPPVTTYVQHVEAIKQKWLAKNSLTINNVLVMSDEQDPGFWNDVKARGWVHTNHTEQRTSEIYGAWYPTIIDTVVQSLAVGLVGTQDSTFSLVGQRRVRDWNNGFTSEVNVRVKWQTRD